MSGCVIVVPCYNETARFDVRRFDEFAARTSGLRLLLVNDGSRDGTLEMLEGLHRRHSDRIQSLNLKQNAGKAEAVRQGCLLALESNPDMLGYWDADLATPLEDILRFADVLQTMPTIDAVVGCRIPLLGRKIERQPLRRMLGRVFANVASLALRLPIYDTQCGAKLFRVTHVLRQSLAEPFGTRWIFDVELLARMTVARRAANLAPLAQSIYEQPLDHWRDVAGSKLRRGDFVKALAEMARIYGRYLAPGAKWVPPALPQPAEHRRAA